MKITKEELLLNYDASIDSILEVCDWKTNFSGEEVCGLVYTILKTNNEKIYLPVEEFYERYSKKCDTEWSSEIKQSQIIDIVWDLLETIEQENLHLS